MLSGQKFLTILIVLSVVLLAFVETEVLGAETPIDFPDPNLEQVIRDAIDKPTGNIYQSDLVGLTTLEAWSKGISDLSGLEYCTDLTDLHLRDNNISDVGALSGLTKLAWLYLGQNNISNISALSGLIKLTDLSLWWNNISNISALSGLNNLTHLALMHNNISNISALSGLAKLAWLQLGSNNISNIAALSGLNNLTHLELWENNITDINALSSLTNLARLWLDHNNIIDIQPLVSNTRLGAGDEVDIRYNYLYLAPGSDDRQNIQTLIGRGVDVVYEPQNPPEFAPSLSIPAHAPTRAVAHVGTRVTFAIFVHNAGSCSDTIKLSHSGEGEWPITLSKTSVKQSAGTQTVVYLSLYMRDMSDKDVTITGTSSGDPSRTSSITLEAKAVDDEGLFLVLFTFHNPPDSSQAEVALSTSGPAMLSTSTLSIPSSYYRNVSLLFDPRRSDTSVREVTLTSTNVATKESVLLPTRFDADEIIATNFNMATDSYSFQNFGLGRFTNCVGMSDTSILYFEGTLPLREGVTTTYELTKEQAKTRIILFQYRWLHSFIGGAGVRLPWVDVSKQYRKLEESIGAGHPMILCIPNHAVVAYKIVIRGSLSYTFIYDSEAPLVKQPNGFGRFAFPYAVYDQANKTFQYGSAKKFLAWKALPRLGDIIAMGLECPVHLRVTDQYGRTVSEEDVTGIPGAGLWWDETEELRIVYLPVGWDYQVTLSAYEKGTFTFRVFFPVSYHTIYAYTYENVSVKSGTICSTDFTGPAVVPDMSVDSDGDGLTDVTISPLTEIVRVGGSGTPVVPTPPTELVTHGPNPVPSQGCVFWLNLPDDTLGATLKIFDIDGAELLGICLDPTADRYPQTGRWLPQDEKGRLLGTGLYLYVVKIKHTDGTTTYSLVQKMVIQQ